MKKFSDFLSAEIHKQNVSVRSIAKKAGIAPSAVSSYMHCGEPNLSKAIALIDALGYRLVVTRKKAAE